MPFPGDLALRPNFSRRKGSWLIACKTLSGAFRTVRRRFFRSFLFCVSFCMLSVPGFSAVFKAIPVLFSHIRKTPPARAEAAIAFSLDFNGNILSCQDPLLGEAVKRPGGEARPDRAKITKFFSLRLAK
nr:hypothetical protein [Bacillaceae bacterium]